MGRMTGSWLSGPQAGLDTSVEQSAYRGEKLGFTESGAGSLAWSWHRVLALFIDWILCGVISLLFVSFTSTQISTVVLAIWFGVGVVCVTAFSFTPGQFITGMRVVRADSNSRVGFGRACARQILIVFIIPPLMNDADGRGLHDRATGTAMIRTR